MGLNGNHWRKEEKSQAAWRRRNQPRGGIRVLAAKPGRDGYDRGAKVGTRAMRDAGIRSSSRGPADARADLRDGDPGGRHAVGESSCPEPI